MKHLTFIIGAGASLDIDHHLSTAELTQYILNPDTINDVGVLPCYGKDIIDLVKEINDYLTKEMNSKPSFEDIYQFLLDMQTQYTLDIPTHLPKYDLPALGRFKKEINLLLIESTIFYILSALYNRIRSERPSIYGNDWHKSIFDIAKKYYDYIDIFTLNYDDYLDYVIDEPNTGFIEDPNLSDQVYGGYRYFDEKRAVDIDNCDILNHLHGSIHFSRYDYSENAHCGPLYYYDPPFTDIGTIQKFNTQHNTIANIAPIITGKDKNNAISHNPFRVYRSNFVRSMIRNDALMVIGYGCGDHYINTAILNYIINQSNRLIWISPTKPSIFDIGDCRDGEITTCYEGRVIWYNSKFKDASKSPLTKLLVESLIKRNNC